MPGRSARALVVDDNEINRDLLGAILRSQGMAVDFAVDGLQAVMMAKAADFDLILMDVNMPLMDGLTATAIIREEARCDARPPVPLFVVSAGDAGDMGPKARLAGANGFIAKPVSFSHIVDLAQRTIATANEGTQLSGSTMQRIAIGVLLARAG